MARVDLGWSNGRRRYKTVYAQSWRAVVDRLQRALRAAQERTLIADERQTLEQFLTRWLADVARVRVRSRTFDTYEAAIRRHIVPYLGKHRLSRLAAQDVQTWLSTLKAADVPVGRRRYARVVLRCALNTARRWALVGQNVATLVDVPRATPREIVPLDPDQARKLLSKSVGHPLHAFVAVALGCGLRLGEALGLHWADIDFDAGTLHVRRALQRSGGDAAKRRELLMNRRQLLEALRKARAVQDRAERNAIGEQLVDVRKALAAVKTTIQLVEPKSRRSRRTIALPAVTVMALRKHRVRQRQARLGMGPAWREQGFVFTTPTGTPCDPHNLHKQFKALLASAGLPPMRVHDLRHSCASLLLAHGVDPRTIMETLGHSQISLTLNTYAHALPALTRSRRQDGRGAAQPGS
jgi:integrase